MYVYRNFDNFNIPLRPSQPEVEEINSTKHFVLNIFKWQ